MKKALSGTLLGLLMGGAVMFYFSWVYGTIYFRSVPPWIESFEFTPQVALMLFQCLLTGAIAGGITYPTGRWGPGIAVSIVVGIGLGFFFVDKGDQPWGTIAALATLLPVMFAGVLSSMAAAVLRIRSRITAEKNR